MKPAEGDKHEGLHPRQTALRGDVIYCTIGTQCSLTHYNSFHSTLTSLSHSLHPHTSPSHSIHPHTCSTLTFIPPSHSLLHLHTSPSHSLLHLHTLHSPDQLQSAGRQVCFEFVLVHLLNTRPQHTSRVVLDNLQCTQLSQHP